MSSHELGVVNCRCLQFWARESVPLARPLEAASSNQGRAERRAPRPCNIAGRCAKSCHLLQRKLCAVLFNLNVLFIVVSNISSAASLHCERPPSRARLSEHYAPSGAASPHPVVILSAVAVHLSCSPHEEQLVVSSPCWGLRVENSACRAAGGSPPGSRSSLSVKHRGLCVGVQLSCSI